MAKLAFVIALLLAVFAAVAAAAQPQEATLAQKKAMFQFYTKKFSRNYGSSDESERRFNVFLKNVDRVAALQQEAQELGGLTQYALNRFFDMSEEEIKQRFLNPNAAAAYVMSLRQLDLPKASPAVRANLPDSFDWREKGAVTPVKDQADCGSCWAFSTTGNVEAVHFLKNGTLTSLSEQHLVDCDHECDPQQPDVCDAGCDGGLMLNAFQFIQKNKGIATEASYPYKGVDGKCKSNYVTGATISGAEQVDEDEQKIAQYLVDHGPLAVALNANDLPYYSGGIFAPKRCDPQGLNHGVLAVGFGKTSAGQEYWLVKNSWSKSWGEQGYFRILRGKGTCGINTYVVSAKI